MKKEVDEVRRKLDEIPEKVRKTTWYHIMKDHALSEQDVIEMINDTNLSDRQFLTLFNANEHLHILQFVASHNFFLEYSTAF